MLNQNHVPRAHTTLLTLMFLCLAMSGIAQIEPQFKFYLAFEDAKQEKDSVWLVMDSTASLGIDTHLNEKLVLLDSIEFQVYFGVLSTLNDSIAKKTFASKPSGALSLYVKAINYEYPITVRWDTNLLKNHNLPFELKQATLYNEFTFGACPSWVCCQHYKHLLDTFYLCPGIGRADSLVLPAGIPSNNLFPIQVYFSKNPFTTPHGIREYSESKPFQIFPNPASKVVNIQPIEGLDANGLDVTILDLSGRTIIEYGDKEIDVSQLTNGIYIVRISHSKHHYHENLIILH